MRAANYDSLTGVTKIRQEELSLKRERSRLDNARTLFSRYLATLFVPLFIPHVTRHGPRNDTPVRFYKKARLSATFLSGH